MALMTSYSPWRERRADCRRRPVNDPVPALEYHRLTVHPRPQSGDPRLVRGYRPLQPERKPPPFKSYPGLEVLALPDELAVKPGGAEPDLAGLSRLLFLSGGVV